MKLPLHRRLFAVATATSVLALAVAACGHEVPLAATGAQVVPTAVAAADFAVEAPAHRTTMPVAPIPQPAAAAPAATAPAAPAAPAAPPR